MANEEQVVTNVTGYLKVNEWCSIRQEHNLAIHLFAVVVDEHQDKATIHHGEEVHQEERQAAVDVLHKLAKMLRERH